MEYFITLMLSTLDSSILLKDVTSDKIKEVFIQSGVVSGSSDFKRNKDNLYIDGVKLNQWYKDQDWEAEVNERSAVTDRLCKQNSVNGLGYFTLWLGKKKKGLCMIKV